MRRKFYRWEIALIVGLLAGMLSTPVNAGEIPREEYHARYQISVLPFGVGHGTEKMLAERAPEWNGELEIRYYVPELWGRIRAAIGL